MKNGRPTLLNDQMIDALCQLFEEGAVNTIACESVGVSISAFKEWRKQGYKDLENGVDTLFSRLITRVNKAKSKIRMRKIAKIDGDDSWQAAAWFLERTMMKDFGRNACEPFDIEGDNHDQRVTSVLNGIQKSQIPVDSGTKIIQILQKEKELSIANEMQQKIDDLCASVEQKMLDRMSNTDKQRDK
jgi:hypothetical protein